MAKQDKKIRNPFLIVVFISFLTVPFICEETTVPLAGLLVLHVMQTIPAIIAVCLYRGPWDWRKTVALLLVTIPSFLPLLPQRPRIWLMMPFAIASFSVAIYLSLRKRKYKFPFDLLMVSVALSSVLLLSVGGGPYKFTQGGFGVVSLIVGGIGAVLGAIVLRSRLRNRWLSLIVCAIFFFLLVNSTLSNLNYLLDTSPPETVTACIENKRIESRGGRQVVRVRRYFDISGVAELETIGVSSGTYKRYNEGDPYTFTRHQGALGEPFLMPTDGRT